VCERWSGCGGYERFLDDMGEAPEGMWLDRVDNGKGYEPGNCRWVTPKESARNRKQRGQVEGSIRQRCRAVGMPYVQVIQRIHRGWSVEQALSIPIQKRGGMTHFDKKRLGLME
jgi:hypothetical protein